MESLLGTDYKMNAGFSRCLFSGFTRGRQLQRIGNEIADEYEPKM